MTADTDKAFSMFHIELNSWNKLNNSSRNNENTDNDHHQQWASLLLIKQELDGARDVLAVLPSLQSIPQRGTYGPVATVLPTLPIYPGLWSTPDVVAS